MKLVSHNIMKKLPRVRETNLANISTACSCPVIFIAFKITEKILKILRLFGVGSPKTNKMYRLDDKTVKFFYQTVVRMHIVFSLTCRAFDRIYRVVRCSWSKLGCILFPFFGDHSEDSPFSTLHFEVKEHWSLKRVYSVFCSLLWAIPEGEKLLIIMETNIWKKQILAWR